MSYFDVYKKKLINKGGSEKNSLLINGQEYIIKHFSDDPSYKEAVLISGYEMEEKALGLRVENIDKSTYNKNFTFLPNAIISQGDYIKYDNQTYIIEEVETNNIVPMAKGIYCNQVLKWSGIDVDIPCYITNDAYGSKILADNAILSTTDTKAKIKVQNNKYTSQITRDFRFIFDSSEYDIFRVIDITKSMDIGMMSLITKKDKLMSEDDLVNNIAFNEFSNSKKEDLTIIGRDKIKISETERYYISTAEQIVWHVDDVTIAQITTGSNGECYVTPLLKDEIIILTATDLNGDIIAEKIISTVR